MEKIKLFIHTNYKVLLGMIVGLIAGYFYWYHYGHLWGTYYLSSECWVNCVFGTLTGGFIMSLLDKKTDSNELRSVSKTD